MNKEDIFFIFLKEIEKEKLITKFLNEIFEYNDLCEYNYIYRAVEKDNSIVIDVYDNISNNRFNRYVFLFSNGKCDKRVVKEDNVYVTYINVLNIKDGNSKIDKLAYLMNLDKDKMIIYGNTFLDKDFIDILKEIIK